MIFGGGGAFVYALYKYQESLLFQPVIMGFKVPEQNPAEYKNPGVRKMPYEDIAFRTSDGERITAWFIPARTQSPDDDDEDRELARLKSPTMLYFHANAGNMGFRLQFLEQVFHRTQFNVFIISYRGYGKSTGEPSEDGLYLDAQAALKWLRESKKVDPTKIFVFGRSLGGAVAINLAHRLREKNLVRGLILENTFTSISAMADKLFPILNPVKPFILRMKFASQDLIRHIRIPILFISGGMDEVVPSEHMQSLWDSATSSKRCMILRVPGGMHNDTWVKAGEKYFEVMRDFLQKVIPDTPQLPAAWPTEEKFTNNPHFNAGNINSTYAAPNSSFDSKRKVSSFKRPAGEEEYENID